MFSRRSFFGGLAAALAAPAIVKASSLMPIKAVKVMPHEDILKLLEARMADTYKVFAEQLANDLYGGTGAAANIWWNPENSAPNYSLIQRSAMFEVTKA